MSKQTPTPGPWYSDKKGQIWRRHPSLLYENGGDVAGDKCLATVHQGWYGEGDTGYPVEANARLIAAAPALLAALKDLERTAGQASMFDDPVRVAARAAIARAEGEA